MTITKIIKGAEYTFTEDDRKILTIISRNVEFTKRSLLLIHELFEDTVLVGQKINEFGYTLITVYIK